MATLTIESISAPEPNVTDSDQRYFAVPVAILIGLPELRCDIYIQHALASRKLLYRSAQADVPIADDEKLKQRNVRHLYLRAGDQGLYDQAVREALAAPPADPALHLALTVEQHREAFQVALMNRSAAPLVAASDKIASDVLQVINRDDFSVRNVVSLLDHDHCTFQHSCNVAIYAATLASRIGLNDHDLTSLTIGGLLHDIGKRQIPGFILRKRGRLEDRERELIRQHPATGFRELAALGQLTWGQLMMAYQHHEWINGAGYPAGVTGDDIHPFARICAVADVFDALTANRPYRESEHAGLALKTMTQEAGHFDPVLIQLWAEIIAA